MKRNNKYKQQVKQLKKALKFQCWYEVDPSWDLIELILIQGQKNPQKVIDLLLME